MLADISLPEMPINFKLTAYGTSIVTFDVKTLHPNHPKSLQAPQHTTPTWFLVLGSWFLVLDSQLLAPGSITKLIFIDPNFLFNPKTDLYAQL